MIPSVSASGLMTLTSTTYWRPSIFPSDPLADAGIDEEQNSDSLGNPRVTGPGVSNAPTLDFGSDPQFPNLALRSFDTSDSRFTKITQQHMLQLPGSGLYSIVARSSARVDGIINATASVWEMNSSIYWDGATASTPISFNLSGIQIEVVRGNSYGDTVGAVGASGLTLTYDQALNLNINSQPPGMAINTSTGVISIPAAQTATYGDNPLPQNVGADYAFSGNIYAKDSTGAERGRVEFDNMFDAVGQPGNAPVVTDGNTTGTAGQTVRFTFTGSDPNNDPLTWRFLSLVGPGGVTPQNMPQINPLSGPSTVFTWNSSSLDPAGTWLGQVEVRDPGGLTDIGDLTITLAAAPQFTPGVTVITHGFQFDVSGAALPADWTFTMADAVLDRAAEAAGASGSYGTILYQYPGSGEWVGLGSSTFNPDQEVVFVYDWATESDRLTAGAGWLEGAADSLFAALLDENLPGSLQGTSLAKIAQDGNTLNLHLIGHSRGAVVNTLVTNRFAQFDQDIFGQDVKIDQVTSIDPHPMYGLAGLNLFGAAGLLGIQIEADPWASQAQPRLPTYSNVTYADNYYRRDSFYELNWNELTRVIIGVIKKDPVAIIGGIVRFVDNFDFDGIPVNGANFIDLSAGSNRIENLLDPLYPSTDLDGYGQEHSDSHLWYHGTIDLTASGDGTRTIGNTSRWYPNGRTTEGYDASRVAGGTRSAAGFGPRTTPPPVSSLFNGDFSKGDKLGNYIPGWDFHGGGGLSSIDGSARYLSLDKKAPTRTHNRFFTPGGIVKFRYKVNKAKEGSVFNLSLDGANAFPLSAGATTGWVDAVVPTSLAAGVHTLGFKLTVANGNPQVFIDDVTIDSVNSTGGAAGIVLVQATPSSGGFRFGSSATFKPVALNDSAFTELFASDRTDDRLAELV